MDDIQRILGRIEEKQDTFGREMKELKADVGNIKETCLRREAPFEEMKDHLKTDKPVEVYANEKVANVALIVLGAVGGCVLTKVLERMM